MRVAKRHGSNFGLSWRPFAIAGASLPKVSASSLYREQRQIGEVCGIDGLERRAIQRSFVGVFQRKHDRRNMWTNGGFAGGAKRMIKFREPQPQGLALIVGRTIFPSEGPFAPPIAFQLRSEPRQPIVVRSTQRDRR